MCLFGGETTGMRSLESGLQKSLCRVFLIGWRVQKLSQMAQKEHDNIASDIVQLSTSTQSVAKTNFPRILN